jgi:magnesium chelatase family protein
VPRVEYEKLLDDRLGEPSAAVQARVEAARGRQRVRFATAEGGGVAPSCNADMRPAEVDLLQGDAAKAQELCRRLVRMCISREDRMGSLVGKYLGLGEVLAVAKRMGVDAEAVRRRLATMRRTRRSTVAAAPKEALDELER